VISDFAFQFRLGLSLWCRVPLTEYESCLWHARAMEPLSSEPPDLVQITIPRWVYNRIAVLLIAAQGGAKVEDYIVAVLQGHMRRLNL